MILALTELTKTNISQNSCELYHWPQGKGQPTTELQHST